MKPLPEKLRASTTLACEHFTYWCVRDLVEATPPGLRNVTMQLALRNAQQRLYEAVTKEVITAITEDGYEGADESEWPSWVKESVAEIRKVLP